MVLASAEQALPPGHSVIQALYHEGEFTLPAAPCLELLVIICLGAATARTGGSYLPRCILIHLLPVIVVPTRATGHHTLQVRIVLSIDAVLTKFAFLKHCIDITRLRYKSMILCFYPITSRRIRQIQQHPDIAM